MEASAFVTLYDRAVSRRGVLSSGAELARAQAPVLALMVGWAAFPVVALVVWVTSHGGVLTGANGYDTFDQLQYLAWIRDAGSHVLARPADVSSGGAVLRGDDHVTGSVVEVDVLLRDHRVGARGDRGAGRDADRLAVAQRVSGGDAGT